MTGLKHWLVPHPRNKHRPRLLKAPGLAGFSGLLVIIQLLYNLQVGGRPQVLGYATNINVNDLWQLTNQQRANYGLGALALNSALNQAALNKANYMFSQQYWAHNAPDGTTPWYFVTQAGYDYQAAGENLAKDFNTSSGVVSAWMDSPSHRQNILNGNYADTGLAAVNGTLFGKQTTIVVAFYASPAQAAPAAAPTAAEPPASQPAAEPPAAAVQAAEAPPAQAANQPAASTAANAGSGLKYQAPARISAINPIVVNRSLGWGPKLSVLLLLLILVLYFYEHFYHLRRGWRRFRHRYLSLAQASVFAGLILVIVSSSLGVIG